MMRLRQILASENANPCDVFNTWLIGMLALFTGTGTGTGTGCQPNRRIGSDR